MCETPVLLTALAVLPKLTGMCHNNKFRKVGEWPIYAVK